MVTADGRVKIADFGIAKATTKMQTGAFLTATGTTVGTPAYMAPEQAMAQDVGPWTDLYSVGCMAYELLAGNVPFHDTDAPMAILLRHVNEPIPAVQVDRARRRPADLGLDRAPAGEGPDERTQYAPSTPGTSSRRSCIALLGPRWRREARLLERTAQVDTPKPLTPAPFEGTSAEPVVSGEFESFAWGAPATPEIEPEPRSSRNRHPRRSPRRRRLRRRSLCGRQSRSRNRSPSRRRPRRSCRRRRRPCRARSGPRARGATRFRS